MDSRRASCRRRLLPHRQSLHLARRPRAGMATGCMDRQLRRVRCAHWVRAFQTAQPSSLTSAPCSGGSRDRRIPSRGCGNDSAPVECINLSSCVASRACTLARVYGCSGISWGPRSRSSASAPSATLWPRIAEYRDAFLSVDRMRSRTGSRLPSCREVAVVRRPGRSAPATGGAGTS